MGCLREHEAEPDLAHTARDRLRRLLDHRAKPFEHVRAAATGGHRGLPCFATATPAPATTKAEVVLMLKLPAAITARADDIDDGHFRVERDAAGVAAHRLREPGNLALRLATQTASAVDQGGDLRPGRSPAMISSITFAASGKVRICPSVTRAIASRIVGCGALLLMFLPPAPP